MATLNLTEARIRELPIGSDIYRDEMIKDLMAICYKTTKTCSVQGAVLRNGRYIRTVRVKVDREDRIRLRDARHHSKKLMYTIH